MLNRIWKSRKDRIRSGKKLSGSKQKQYHNWILTWICVRWRPAHLRPGRGSWWSWTARIPHRLPYGWLIIPYRTKYRYRTVVTTSHKPHCNIILQYISFNIHTENKVNNIFFKKFFISIFSQCFTKNRKPYLKVPISTKSNIAKRTGWRLIVPLERKICAPSSVAHTIPMYGYVDSSAYRYQPIPKQQYMLISS